ncbi:MAG: NYN domain-containing protein [Ignavibacteriae bacterium]|nr:NYN domain-containing protein [Ignavibacteriota bacterium]
MKIVIIDSNNLIHKVPDFRKMFNENPESAQLALVESVKTKVNRNYRLIFVFDGFGRVKKNCVEYSGNKKADDVIRKYIEDNYMTKTLCIVSSDAEIKRLAKICGCEVMNSEAFWKEINPSSLKNKNINQLLYKDGEKPDRISKKELDEFKKYFT